MKATILLPTYNRPALLAEALASAADQELSAADHEVVVVNDGGTSTEAGVRSAWKGKAELRYFCIEHAGLSAAINRGFRESHGECVTVLPDDDLIYPNKLSLSLDYLQQHPEASVVYSLPQYVDQTGKPIATPRRLRAFLLAHPVLTWGHIEKRHGMWVHGVGTVYRSAAWRAVGPWQEELPLAEEYEFHLRLLHAGYDFHALDAVTTAYRKHSTNKSRGRHSRIVPYRKIIYAGKGTLQQ